MGTAALISLAAARFVSASPLEHPAVSSDCSTPGAAARAAGRHLGMPVAVSEKLDDRGQLTGREMTGNAGGRGFVITLPAESSVSVPVGDALAYTRALGGKSEVHLVDLATGCDVLLARPAGTVRSAVFDPVQSAIYAHSVSFPTRTDAGVARYALDGSGASLVVPPLPDDARFGLTFGTKLGWSTDGATLFVHSCGADECRTRLLDVASGSVTTIDTRGHGEIIGLTPTHLVTYGMCSGLPCAVISHDLGSGTELTLADEAWSSSFDGTTLNIETAAGNIEVAQ